MGNPSSLMKRKPSRRAILWFIIAAIIALFGGLYLYRAEVPQVLAQSAIGSLQDAGAAANGQKVLVFSPHPDDETIAIGGYIAQSIKDGAEVKIVLVTDGNWHHQKDLRYSEFKKATGILGVTENNLVFLNFPDGRLRKQNPTMLYKALKEQIDLYDPDIVIFPTPRDYNPDHSTIGRLMEEILEAEPQERTVYEYLVHYEILYPRPRKFDPNLNLLPPDKLITADQWQCFPLSQDIENLKMSAIFTYKSQLNDHWLKGLLLSYVRRNELLAIPKKLGAQ